MKLINILNEAAEDALIKKGRDVYEFLKHGALTFTSSGVRRSYKYTLPDNYSVSVNNGNGRTDSNNRPLGLQPLITIPPKDEEDGDWMTLENAILFEPSNKEDEDFLLSYGGSVASKLESYLQLHKFAKYRVIFSSRDILIKINYEGNMRLIRDISIDRNKKIYDELKQGRINFKESYYKDKGFTYKLPNKVSIGPSSITVTGQVEYKCDEDCHPKYEYIKEIIIKEFSNHGVYLHIWAT